MPDANRPTPRVLVGAVTSSRSKLVQDLAKVIDDEVRAGGFTLVRSVVVNGEAQFVTQLVSNVSNDNEADAIVLVGGTGFGPHDHAVEALDHFVERRIEGFGEAYRRLLREGSGEAYRSSVGEQHDFGVHSWLVRATAGVYNQCLVFALSGRASDLQRAMQTLIAPTLVEAVELATGRMRALQLKA
jgi:molybdenum cofactor biosynthesis protein B